jgi:hypothetical protein
MDAAKVEDAVMMADESLKKMMEKNGYKVYERSGGGQKYAKAVATLAAGILIADAKKSE